MGSWPVLLVLVLSAIVQSRGQSSESQYSRFEEVSASSCNLLEFRCRNGQCISGELLCDGAAHCRDGSDETPAACDRPDSPGCGPRAYRCAYGACVDGDARCNGTPDCADGSDEVGCPKRNGTPATAAPGTGCRLDQYRCKSGQCIARTELCDGTVNCRDRSDETLEACRDFECPGYVYRCRYGGCVDRDKKCDGVINCADGSDEDHELCGRPRPNRPDTSGSGSTSTTTTTTTTRPVPAMESCELPDQPENGEWRLDKSLCADRRDCHPQPGVKRLPPGTQLVFSCYAGYRLNGSRNVFCGLQGRWSEIPRCAEIRCPALSSAALEARCTADSGWVSCDNPVPVKTLAELSCRNSYVPDTSDLTRRDTVRCSSRGEWEPNPIKCISVCGVPSSGIGTPLVVNGTSAKVAEFPWHATLYILKNDVKQFICGATIIRNNLLITAAHCVFDEVSKHVDTPSKYFVAVGNVFRDYDFEGHDLRTVRKAQVKDIFVVCNYLGLEGNYASDIAILQIDKPFIFSSIIMPICLDVSTAGDQASLEAGNYGKVAGFGRTAVGETSFVLQTITVPYVPLNTCKSSSIASDSVKYITIDKFCAGYSNGSSVCDGDSGGGLVFKTDNKWYLRGIVSVGIGATKLGAVRVCDSYSYSLYTRISSHMDWIQDIILRVETSRPFRTCS